MCLQTNTVLLAYFSVLLVPQAVYCIGGCELELHRHHAHNGSTASYGHRARLTPSARFGYVLGAEQAVQ